MRTHFTYGVGTDRLEMIEASSLKEGDYVWEHNQWCRIIELENGIVTDTSVIGRYTYAADFGGSTPGAFTVDKGRGMVRLKL